MCQIVLAAVVGLVPLGSTSQSPVKVRFTGQVACNPGDTPQSISIQTAFTSASGIVPLVQSFPGIANFDITLPITTAVACGDQVGGVGQPFVQIDATCVSPTGVIDTCSWRPFTPSGVALDCTSPCPQIISFVGVGDCLSDPWQPADGARPVGFTIYFDPPLGPNAVGSIVLNFSGADVFGRISSTYSFPTSPPPNPFVFQSAFKHLPNPYAMSATISLVNQNSICTSNIIFSSDPSGSPPGVVIDPCLPCPDKVQVDIVTPSGWCVPSGGVATGAAQFTATVIWPAGVASPPLATTFDWAITLPDGSQAKLANVAASATGTSQVSTQDFSINLNQVGTYVVSTVANFPASAGLPTNPDGTPACVLTGGESFALASCMQCPSITISLVTADCADPASGKPANIDFQANLSDPSGTATSIDWNFGDPASGNNTASNPPGVLTASHPYANPGNYPVTATVKHPTPCDSSSGGSDTASLALTVTQCSTGGGGGGGGNLGCFIARNLIAALFGAAIGALFIGLCLASHFMPPQSTDILDLTLKIVGVLLSLGIVALVVWLILVSLGICPGVCAWGLLLLGEVLIVAGWTMIVLYPCCPSLWFGLVGIAGGFSLLLLWRQRCRISWCDLWAEILAMLVGSALSIINAVAQLPLKQVANCQISSWLVALLSILIVVLGGVVGTCKSKSGGGAPP